METDVYLRFILALILVVGLIVLAGVLGRRFGVTPRVSGSRGRRLSVVEVAAVDAKNRLVLIKRDDIEHLVMVGPGQSLLIERGIGGQKGSLSPVDEVHS